MNCAEFYLYFYEGLEVLISSIVMLMYFYETESK